MTLTNAAARASRGVEEFRATVQPLPPPFPAGVPPTGPTPSGSRPTWAPVGEVSASRRCSLATTRLPVGQGDRTQAHGRANLTSDVPGEEITDERENSEQADASGCPCQFPEHRHWSSSRSGQRFLACVVAELDRCRRRAVRPVCGATCVLQRRGPEGAVLGTLCRCAGCSSACWLATGWVRLTIRSSRSRFAARPSSGVRRDTDREVVFPRLFRCRSAYQNGAPKRPVGSTRDARVSCETAASTADAGTRYTARSA